jgi:hypothetical protein
VTTDDDDDDDDAVVAVTNIPASTGYHCTAKILLSFFRFITFGLSKNGCTIVYYYSWCVWGTDVTSGNGWYDEDGWTTLWKQQQLPTPSSSSSSALTLSSLVKFHQVMTLLYLFTLMMMMMTVFHHLCMMIFYLFMLETVHFFTLRSLGARSWFLQY